MQFVLVCLLAASAVASTTLKKSQEPVPDRYIIKLKEGADPSPILEAIDKTHELDSHVEVLQRYEQVFNGFSATLPKGLLSMILEFDEVESVEEDGVIHLEGVSTWGLDRIDQKLKTLDNTFNPIGDGEGVNIYVLDTGINYAHEEFEGRNVEYHSVIGEGGEDCHGHGTHCAATAAGNTYGVAQKANIISIRCMKCGGTGVISDIVAALEWVAANATTPAVVSMSIAGGGSDDLDEAVEAVTNKKGILVVVAAGNGGTNACTWSPPRVSVALSVGATDKDDKTWSSSNRGSCVDIMAPGVDVKSAWIGGTNPTKVLSGTSMATPHAAGAAAVLLGQDPSLTAEELKARLQEKAVANAVTDCDAWTPNLLVYLGEGNGGGSVPSEHFLPTECGATISSDGSYVTSPSSPYNYNNNQNCKVLLDSSSSDLGVMITFSEFHVEWGTDCRYDNLKIYNGDSVSEDDELKNHLCGDVVPEPIYSYASEMTLLFTSDSSVTRSGYIATVNFIDKDSVPEPCSQTINTDGSEIVSANYPNNYGNNELCKYRISAPSDSKIRLSFTDFDIEQDGGCRWDQLKVYDGSSSDDSVLKTLCGQRIPNDIRSTGNEMYIKFTSDYVYTRKGFKATVTFFK